MLLELAWLVLLALRGCRVAATRNLISLSEDTWTDILHGEWMVEFHAPWCPACKDLQKAWHSFADWSRDLNINVAEVDVTRNPGLSGRFLVTALPTIYHVKDGVFRQYSGPRDKNDFISYIEERKWTFYDPVPSYKHPNSPQMTVVAWFFKLSMFVRDKHNYFVEEGVFFCFCHNLLTRMRWRQIFSHSKLGVVGGSLRPAPGPHNSPQNSNIAMVAHRIVLVILCE
ncbi:unnamed protein product [Gongylonema pulchrum]|uniref:Thioredoxin-related transmembrane protein 1 n=1 Tax=Gongylonema pulchrum TaxID=637853 RepID=A0A183DR11_9BILA|nr:unnamed protein product [Gongylonema pulchrum]